ncbi:CGL144 [Auxenochlorella protothecoides x Auxenochlorella symbiontica]
MSVASSLHRVGLRCCSGALASSCFGTRRPARVHTRLHSSAVQCHALGSSDGADEIQPVSSRSTAGKGFGKAPPASEALRSTLGELSDRVGRVAQTNNVVLGTGDESEWRELDAQVNAYPADRTFKAIGSGGDDFVASMTSCVERVVGVRLPSSRVTHRLSAGGKYVSVTIGPVLVETPDQVLAIFNGMKADGRLKFYI